MLVQKLTRFHFTEHRKVEPGIVVQDEGIALVYSKVSGDTYVRPSTGAAGEIFAGFSVSRNCPPQFIPKVIGLSDDGSTTIVPTSGVLDLGHVPVTGQILVKIDGEVATIGANTPSAAGSVQLVGQKLYFFTGTTDPVVAGDTEKDLYVQFIYEPTIVEARMILGDAPIGGLPSTPQEVIGVTCRMEAIGTTYYDASVDWATTFTPRLGANGVLTTGGSGTLLTNVVVMSGPSGDPQTYGALGLKVIAA